LLDAIGRLMQLTRLWLCGTEGMTQHGFMQLTGLSRLPQRSSAVWNPRERALRPVPKSNETKLLVARAVVTLKPSDKSIFEIHVM
jgi:hypothetical protein